MSDTDRPALTTAPHMYLHYCEETGCNEWGSWGNSQSAAATNRWWCFEHFPHKTYEQEQALAARVSLRKPGALRGKIRISDDFDSLPADVLKAMEDGT